MANSKEWYLFVLFEETELWRKEFHMEKMNST